MAKERRKYLRIFVNAPVKFTTKSEDGEGYIINLSLSGLCMATPTKLALGEVVTLNFTLGGDMKFTLSGKVKHITGKYYCGIEFLPKDTEEIFEEMKLEDYILATKAEQDSWLRKELKTDSKSIEAMFRRKSFEYITKKNRQVKK